MREYLIAALLAIALLFVSAAAHYRIKATEWRTTAQQSQQVAGQQAATITYINQRQQQLAALDKTHTEALSAAESENDALRRQLAACTSTQNVPCPVSGTGKAAGSGGMGDATAVELSSDSRRNILDIRAGIIRDREKLKYLQDYIQTQCLK